MSWMKKIVNKVDVRSIDERVQSRYVNVQDEEIAVFTLDVEEAEAYIELLQKAIEEAKKSKYYQPKD